MKTVVNIVVWILYDLTAYAAVALIVDIQETKVLPILVAFISIALMKVVLRIHLWQEFKLEEKKKANGSP
jgi:hypothetical protein